MLKKTKKKPKNPFRTILPYITLYVCFKENVNESHLTGDVKGLYSLLLIENFPETRETGKDMVCRDCWCFCGSGLITRDMQ